MNRKNDGSPILKNRTLGLSPLSARKVTRSDKLKVFVKFKPEDIKNHNEDVKRINKKQVQIKTNLKHKIYQFDQVFSSQSTQVFQIAAKNIVETVFQQTLEQKISNKGLIFVYGNTGTGKTYSMGLLQNLASKSKGIVPEALRLVFQLSKRSQYKNFSVGVSFCQIYMQQIWDLLSLQGQCNSSLNQKTRTPFLQNLTTITVKNQQQAFQLINIGLQRRKVAQQKLNRKSSRGHGVINIKIDSQNGHSGQLCLIDLAGCQRIKQSQSAGSTLNEAVHINSSLSSLQTLLTNIAGEGVRNYRSSKLTRLLQPFFQHGKISLLVTANSTSKNAIQFARRCRGLKLTDKQPPLQLSGSAQIKALKQAFNQRQQMYKQCIKNLCQGINRIVQELQTILKGQKMYSAFSFAEITGLTSQQQTINNRIQKIQQMQRQKCQQYLLKIQYCKNIKLQQIVKQQCIQQLIRNVCGTIKGIGDITEKRNNFKQEYFTSEMKVQLLQERCRQIEQGVHHIIKYCDLNDKRITRKIKQIGICLPHQDIQNQAHHRNKCSKNIQKYKKTTKIDKSHSKQAQQQNNLIITDRGPIFIDQL